jgi:hypothetical protein
MRTENQRSYNTGCVLTEPELRRIHHLIIEQFHKHLGSTVNTKVFYEIRYRNGSISKPNSLDTIINQENIASAALTRLKITFTDDNTPSLYQVTLRFTNPDLVKFEIPISYTIVGNDRDWVFIITSLLDERIKRIRRFSINMESILMAPVIGVSTLATTSLLLSIFGTNSNSQQLNKLKIIEQNYKNGKFKNPIEALIEIEKYKLDTNDISIPTRSVATGFGLTMVLIIIVFCTWYYCFPSYNFCWGEYVAYKKRRENIGKFILVTVILSLVIGVTVNYISARLGI